jgi:outer membrane receptor protein involved in Fe transport
MRLDDIIVKAKGQNREMIMTPMGTTIDPDKYETIGPSTSVLDLLDTQAIIDFRGISDLTPDEDTITMRGFSSNRFVTAIDGLTVQKTGGRKGSHIVDYALMPSFLIDKVEILPGPHSAMYDAKAIGGVVNMITRAPEQKESLIPDIGFSTSYSSYNTQNHNLNIQGSVKAFTYDVGYQKNSTDGYLRQGETDINTFFSRLGFILPMEGYVSLSGSYSTADRETPVNNDPESDYYDSDYPTTEGSLFDPWQDPTWDKEAWAYRLNYQQNLPMGRLSLGAYTSKEDRDRASWNWVDTNDHSQGIEYTPWITTWRQHGGKIMDEYQWTDNHTTTVGFDMVKLYDGNNGDGDERVNKKGTFLQHQWEILPSLNLKLGLRYEDVKIHVSNNPASQIPNKGNWIVRNWDELIPKSFITWKMDTIAGWLRDTTLSAGVSKIWHAPDAHGDYNPQGRPTGAWLEPEHGMGYDLVFMRRLFNDIDFKVNYSFCDIKDYIASNSNYAQYSGASAGDLRYSDYKINLEEVYRHGVELELDGNLSKDLSFYLTYAWQTYENQGDEPAGKAGLDDAAEHRVSCGLRYNLFEQTILMLDYQYQTKETMEVSEEYDDPNHPGESLYTWYQVDNPAYGLFDLGIKQKLFMGKGLVKDVALSCYIKNLFDETYYSSRGYPSTDRTFGATLSFSM